MAQVIWQTRVLNLGPANCDFLSKSFFHHVEISHITLTPEDMTAFGKCTKLISLKLKSKDMSDDTVQDLSFLTNLKSLDLSDSNIGDIGVQILSSLSLKYLNLTGNFIRDIGAQTVRYLRHLTFLNFEYYNSKND